MADDALEQGLASIRARIASTPDETAVSAQPKASDEMTLEQGLEAIRQRIEGYNVSPEPVQPPIAKTGGSSDTFGMRGGAGQSFVEGIDRGVPFIGDYVLALKQRRDAFLNAQLGRSEGRTYEQELAHIQGQTETAKKEHPIANIAGEITGSAVALAPLGPLLTTPARSAAIIGGIEGADTALKGGSAKEIALHTALGAAGGAIAPWLGNKLAGSVEKAKSIVMPKVVTPEIDAMLAQKTALYKAVGDSGVAVAPQNMMLFTKHLRAGLKNEHITDTVAPGTVKEIARLERAAIDALRSRKPIPLLEVDDLRKVFGNVAGLNPSEARASAIVIRGIDNFLGDTTLSRLVAPKGVNTSAVVGQLEQARGIVTRLKKSQAVEELIRKAHDGKGNRLFADALRQQFSTFVKNKRNLRGFSKDEVKAMQDVARSTTPARLISSLAYMTHYTTFSAMRAAGFAAGGGTGAAVGGAFGGPIGAIAGAAAFPAAAGIVRGVTNQKMLGRANRMSAGLRRGNVQAPQASQPNFGTVVGSAAALTAARPPERRKKPSTSRSAR